MYEPIETYDTIVDSKGNYYLDRYILAIGIQSIDINGEIGRCSIGTDNMLEVPSITFIIDENIYEQLDDLRVKLIDGMYRLVPKEGYKFKTIEETETPEQRKIRELEEQLAKLKANH